MDWRSLIAEAIANPEFQELCDSPVTPLIAAVVGYQLMPRIIRKFIVASMSQLKQRRYEGRSFVSRVRHPTRSKFKGAARCFRQRFNDRAVFF